MNFSIVKAWIGAVALLQVLVEAVPQGRRDTASSGDAMPKELLLPTYLYRPSRQTYCRLQSQLTQVLFADSLVHPHGSADGHIAGGLTVSPCQPKTDPEVVISWDWPLASVPSIVGGCVRVVASAAENVTCKSKEELQVVTGLVKGTNEFRSRLQLRETICSAHYR